MKKAMISGGLTSLGLFLAILAVYRGVRLDWAETALVAGLVLLTLGLQWFFNFIREVMLCDEE